MTVKELIEKLQTMNQDYEVKFSSYSDGHYDISGVDYEEDYLFHQGTLVVILE